MSNTPEVEVWEEKVPPEPPMLTLWTRPGPLPLTVVVLPLSLTMVPELTAYSHHLTSHLICRA